MWSAIGRLLIGLLLSAHLRGSERFEKSEPHMGTLFRIVLYADNAREARAGFSAAFGRIAQLDNRLSDYKEESELNRICREAVGQDREVSEDLYTVLKASQALSARVDGAFDITVGPLVREWRAARRTGRLPAPDALAAALRLTGYSKLHLGTHTARLDLAGMQLDLGAIAKGYAADEGLAVLRHLGFRQALVAASGDLAFGDPPPGKRGWKIGIDALPASEVSLGRILELSNAAVSTSGDTEQFVEIGGERYSHILDPRTGTPLMRRIGVTVIAAKAIDADSLATALSVFTARNGPSSALQLLRETGARGIIRMESDGAIAEFSSEGQVP